VPIDFQWTGVNYGAQDVAYMLLSSAALDELSDGSSIESRLAEYWEEMKAATSSRSAGAPMFTYTFEEFVRDFKLACLDYTRIVFAYQLKGRDASWVRRGASALGRCTHNRSVPHLLGLVRFLDAIVLEWETSGDLSGQSRTMPGYAGHTENSSQDRVLA